MTPEPQERDLEAARSAVAQMFSCVGIRRVICVDDVYAGGLGAVKEALAAATPEERAKILGEDVAARMDDEDVVRELAARAWDSGSADQRDALLARARDCAGRPEAGEFLSLLGSLLPDVEREGLGLAEWRKREDALIGELKTTPTLIFFDQSFVDEEPGTESAGPRLIAAFEARVAAEEPPVAYYGLLTNLVQPEDEHERRQAIVADNSLDSARFVLVSKGRLSQPLPEFAAKLRTILLAPLFAGLFHQVTSCVNEVREDAVTQAKSIEPEDLEHIHGPTTPYGIGVPTAEVRRTLRDKRLIADVLDPADRRRHAYALTADGQRAVAEYLDARSRLGAR